MSGRLAALLTPWLLLHPLHLAAGAAGPAAPPKRVAERDTDTRSVKVIVLNYDPILH